jgi:hypothetical protein
LLGFFGDCDDLSLNNQDVNGVVCDLAGDLALLGFTAAAAYTPTKQSYNASK